MLNQHIFKVIEDGNRMSKVFLHLLLRQNLDRIIKSAHGFKLSFMHVTRAELTEVGLAVPPRDEQDRIVAVADAHDRLAITEEQHLAKLLRIKSGLMTDLLTGRVPVPADLLGETA